MTRAAQRRRAETGSDATKVDNTKVDKTLSKGLRLIEMLARSGGSGLAQLAEDAGYTKSNVHRLLQTLGRAGWVRPTGEPGRYELTFKLWEIAQNWILRFDLPRIAAPWIARLGAATQETVHLAVLEQNDVVFIATVETPQAIRIHAPLGSRAPAHCTATGKAILAFLPAPGERLAVDRLASLTKESLTGPRLIADLDRTRRRGYALNHAEWQDSVNGIAAPVFMGTSDKVIASVGLFGPAARLTQSALRRFAPLVQDAARGISQGIGGTG
jgi:IclR family transcriptional regulator, KDG regulon repressor